MIILTETKATLALGLIMAWMPIGISSIKQGGLDSPCFLYQTQELLEAETNCLNTD
jgi:hypothetical protein